MEELLHWKKLEKVCIGVSNYFCNRQSAGVAYAGYTLLIHFSKHKVERNMVATATVTEQTPRLDKNGTAATAVSPAEFEALKLECLKMVMISKPDATVASLLAQLAQVR
jgi:hypothetical protein